MTPSGEDKHGPGITKMVRGNARRSCPPNNSAIRQNPVLNRTTDAMYVPMMAVPFDCEVHYERTEHVVTGNEARS